MQKNESKTYQFVIFFLSVLLLVVIFVSPKPSVAPKPSITIGNSIQIKLIQNGASSVAITFDGSSVGGDAWNQSITTMLPQESASVLLKVGLYIANNNGDKIPINVDILPNWTKSGDFLYYNSQIVGGQILNVCKKLIIPSPSSMLLFDDLTYNILVNAETILVSDFNNGYKWLNTPQEWVDALNL
ncbi:MAG: hypothetical protein RR140_00460 [Clostridia bacterium]